MKIEARFCKRDILQYISHLDIVRLFQRAIRRAGLPVKLTEGYSPHYKISFERALKLGVPSEDEKAIFTFNEDIDPEDFKNSLNKQLPKEIQLLDSRII